MAKIILPAILFFLLFPGIIEAQAVPKKTHVLGGCRNQVETVLKVFSDFKPAGNFDLYLICNQTDWDYVHRTVSLPTGAVAFSDLKQRIVYLSPAALGGLGLLRQSVEHELEHLRCNCTLGERGF